jgi:predicted amidohydrolase YtcJ
MADVVLHHGRITTLDRSKPVATAVAIKHGKFILVGGDQEALALAGPASRVVDLKGRSVLPGLFDNHTHVVRGGLNYNLELRWDGVRSLADAMDMLRRQVAITPAPQWVRVVGGFTEHQFVEKRLPTIDEINAIAPDTPVFLLHLYDRALLNGAALRAVGYTRDTPEPPGGEITRDAAGNPTGLLLAKPNAMILYATLAKGPKLPFDYQLNSTRHFMRELNRLGVTGVIDAGGGFQNYPDDYAVIQKLADAGQMTVRLAYNLFTQKPKEEKDDFLKWTSSVKYQQGDDYFRHNGAGEMLVFSAADFEDFRQPRPDMPPQMEDELEQVVRNPGAAPLALAPARDLRRNHRARARCLREGRPRDSAEWTELVLRSCRDPSRTGRSTASPRSAAALPCSIAWPTRASTLSSATAARRPRPRRP